MRRESSLVPRRALCVLTVLLTTLALNQLSRDAEGAMITYISSTRYIEGNGILREDAVGYTDFVVSRGVFVGVPNTGTTYARVEASQTSRLLSDRIEVSCSTLTQFIQNPFGNSILAQSFVDVAFSIDEPIFATFSTGPIFSQSNGGIGTALLARVEMGLIPVFSAIAQADPMSATLTPGTYRFIVQSESQSRQGFAGPAQAVATLTLPPVSTVVAFAGAVGLGFVNRKRR